MYKLKSIVVKDNKWKPVDKRKDFKTSNRENENKLNFSEKRIKETLCDVYDFLRKISESKRREFEDETLELLDRVNSAIDTMDGLRDGINMVLDANNKIVKKSYAEAVNTNSGYVKNKSIFIGNNNKESYKNSSAWQEDKTITFIPDNKELIKEKLDTTMIAKYLEHVHKGNLITRIERTFNGGIRMMWKNAIDKIENQRMTKLNLGEINLGLWTYDGNKYEGQKSIVIDGIDTSIEENEILNDLIERNNHICNGINEENSSKCKAIRLKRKIFKDGENGSLEMAPSRAVRLILPKAMAEDIQEKGYLFIGYSKISRIRDYEYKIRCNKCGRYGHVEVACWSSSKDEEKSDSEIMS